MDDSSETDRMMSACVAAAELVKQHGSPELCAAMRVLLFVLAQDVAGRVADVSKGVGTL